MPDVLGGFLSRPIRGVRGAYAGTGPSGLLTQSSGPTTLGALDKSLNYLNPLNAVRLGILDPILAGGRLVQQAAETGEVRPGEVLPVAAAGLSGGLLSRPGGATLGAGPTKFIAKFSKDVPEIRNLPIPEAISIAEKEPHLIPKKGGGFVGAPPGVKTRFDLLKMRQRFDKKVAEGGAGADWYDRYRAGTMEITGGEPRDVAAATQQQALFSQGRSPSYEVQSSTKENLGLLMGMPERANYGTQHAKMLASAEANDPSLLTAGTPKLGQYASKNMPDVTVATATGTNDFRHANNFGFRVGSGTTKTSLTPAQHRFVDYETALAVKRARDRELGGIKDWTGDMAQAAPWVVDKANSIVATRNLVQKYLVKGFNRRTATRMAYDEAFAEANKVPADFFGKHTAFATHEAQPGVGTGYLPRSEFAMPAERSAFGFDPRSTFATAPGGRDAIYGGLRLGETGIAPRVRPSQTATGMFEGISNPAQVGRPLISFTKGQPGLLDPQSRGMLQAGETLRAAMDVQNAGAAHTVSRLGPQGERRSLFVPMNRKLTEPEIYKLHDVGKKYGLLGISDTGEGVTVTNFGDEPKVKSGLLDAISKAAPADAVEAPYRVKVDSVYADLADKWKQGEGSGAVTREVLDKLNVTKEARAAFDNNPYLAKAALDRIARDKEWTQKWGVGRKDVEKFRKIIAGGKGWIGRMETVLKRQPGTLPALAVGVFTGLSENQGGGE